jgi:hypothetical protein
VTKPKPLLLPLSLSFMMSVASMAPYWLKCNRSVSSLQNDKKQRPSRGQSRHTLLYHTRNHAAGASSKNLAASATADCCNIALHNIATLPADTKLYLVSQGKPSTANFLGGSCACSAELEGPCDNCCRPSLSGLLLSVIAGPSKSGPQRPGQAGAKSAAASVAVFRNEN